MSFPADWPEKCPPGDAIDAEGIVYRLVKHWPPRDTDLASHWEMGRLPNAPACLRCGLSVFRELQDVLHQRKLLPKLGNTIAQATLSAEHGKTKLTTGQQPTHTTWWAYQNVNRAGLFEIVAEKG